MNLVFSIAVRAVFTFVALLALQFVIHYLILVAGGVVAGLFLWKLSDDRALGFGILIGTVVFGIFAYLYGSV